jgi:predicted O-methyltransferase YrrM
MWMEALHSTDPYEQFPIGSYKLDLQGWGSNSPIFEAVISLIRPSRVVEVGTWKGASAIHMAELMRKQNIVGKIVCVDTWLGTVNTWLEREGANFTPMKNGRPTVYEQFLANVIHSGHTKTIIPFPVDSITAADFMAQKQLQADVIYLDAGHDYEHVMSDLKAWWPVLRPGGLMFGDDYHVMWHGVVRAVHAFAEAHGLNVLTRFQDKWYFQKPQ